MAAPSGRRSPSLDWGARQPTNAAFNRGTADQWVTATLENELHEASLSFCRRFFVLAGAEMQPAIPACRYDRYCDSETTGMPNMTKLVQHIAEMNNLLIQTTTSEQSLVKALGDALSQVDHQLVRDIRKVALEHQARRAEVFLELQA